jgi:hypothetical protein
VADTREASTVTYFRTADAAGRARVLRRKLDSILIAVQTAQNDMEQLAAQVHTPMQMVDMLVADADVGVAGEVEELKAGIRDVLAELTMAGPHGTGWAGVIRASEKLRGLL